MWSTWHCSTWRPVFFSKHPEGVFRDPMRPVTYDLMRLESGQSSALSFSHAILTSSPAPDCEQCLLGVRSIASDCLQ
jgi:hypothetical protein